MLNRRLRAFRLQRKILSHCQMSRLRPCHRAWPNLPIHHLRLFRWPKMRLSLCRFQGSRLARVRSLYPLPEPQRLWSNWPMFHLKPTRFPLMLCRSQASHPARVKKSGRG